MHKIINQIRDLELIESELETASAGILAVNIDNEKTVQLATTFLYRDKNIYLLFKPRDEFFENLQFNSAVSFTVLKNDKIKKQGKIDFNPTYNYFTVTVAGILKKIDEDKVIREVRESYLKKYTKKSDPGRKNVSSVGEVIIIDTEEIHAFEEIGG